MNETRLTDARVTEIFRDCLFKDDEDKSNYVLAKGLVMDAGFHPGRLESHKEEIEKLLAELPDGFRQSKVGMSFLSACEDRHGEQWTGLHQTMEQLFLLGIAVGKARYAFPRERWCELPGATPYIVVNR